MACEAIAIVGLTRLGHVSRWQVDWANFWTWLQAASLGDALAGILRWAMLALAWWLLASSVLYCLARLTRVPTLIRGAGWLTLPFVRFAVDRALVVTLAATTVVGARTGVALAHSASLSSPAPASAAPSPSWNQADGGSATPGSTQAATMPALETNTTTPDPPPPRATTATDAGALAPAAQYEVRAGDNLWSISAGHLADASGKDASALAAEHIAPYWWTVCEMNRSTLRSGHPNLIHPGEVVRLPAVVPSGDGFAAGSTTAKTPRPVTPSATPSEPAPMQPAAPTTVVTPGPAPPGHKVTPTSAVEPTSTTVVSGPPTTTPAPPGPTGSSAVRSRDGVSTGGADSFLSLNPWLVRAAMASAIGLPAFALAGWLVKLRRGRIIQASHCRPGRDVVRPDPEVEPLERAALTIAADQTEEWIDAALRALTADLAATSLVATPDLRCIRAGEMGLEVLLAEAFETAPPGWESADGGYVWRLGPGVDLEELRRRGADHAALTPALVSLGSSPEGPILADLESFGALSVEGDADRVRAFLAGVALELASASWAQGVQLRVYGLDGFERLEEVAALDGPALVREAGGMVDLLAPNRAAAGSVLAARVAGADDGEPCYPMVVVVGADADPVVVEDLVELASGRSGMALVGVMPAGVDWQLVVGPDGAAVLKPLGMGMRMSGVDETPARAVENGELGPDDPAGLALDQSLDEANIGLAVGALAAVAQEGDVARPIPRATPPRSNGARLRRREDFEVWVSVLRRTPEVSGWANEPRGRRKLAEVLVYLAVYGADRPVPGGELRTHCWPAQLSAGAPGERPQLQEVSADSFHQAMSRLRKQLGEGSKGWYLPMAVDGAYSLGPGIGCDWTVFRGLVSAGRDAATQGDTGSAIALYREGLELVKGEPFTDVPARSYDWAESEQLVTDIRLAVARAAHELADLAVEAEPKTALWATEQGRLLLPTQLGLFDMAMAASAELGDCDGIDREMNAKCWALEQLDPDGGIPPETNQLYRDLMARAKRATPVRA